MSLTRGAAGPSAACRSRARLSCRLDRHARSARSACRWCIGRPGASMGAGPAKLDCTSASDHCPSGAVGGAIGGKGGGAAGGEGGGAAGGEGGGAAGGEG
eukprot:scaffold99102_cov48-Phaeocystis_antarctica.AAC.2